MAALFSDDWMKQFKDAWNAEPEVRDRLAEIDFDSVVYCGFKNEDTPRGLFVIEKGECVRAGAWSESEPAANWDMRADLKDWLKWIENGVGMMGLGTAFATGKLKFLVGDYKGMLKDPRMANPFIKCFGLMHQVDTDELK
ncbi:SCP2 sterol-binding domain-containing protein [Marichromatium bheemlicum]|uniref:SCP-2 sterol transfer family protein n=1 Tax=Marichromatium bheemlicum TaxID=365339 RepID=A0ABX1IBY8_9GAMM|nr:SCP2 sterol-binding domain-containing protein [Marichromatium bheemlicum]NKN34534.1 SCP-2 sterol transfer family protein [Marichromatium bheemlicum]